MTHCPECGIDLTDLDPIAHRNMHWGEVQPNPQQYPDAAARWRQLTDMASQSGGA